MCMSPGTNIVQKSMVTTSSESDIETDAGTSTMVTLLGDGDRVGAWEGRSDGALVGAEVGRFDGPRVGRLVGWLVVGNLVGEPGRG